MDATWVEKRTEENNDLVEFQREYTVLEATELICKLMAEKNVKRSELASLLGKSKGYISQLLDGETNMTLATLSDVFTALGACLRFGYVPLTAETEHSVENEPPRAVSWVGGECAWRGAEVQILGSGVQLTSPALWEAIFAPLNYSAA
ncbi:hypothetical protein Pan44_04410 [Caulifigura coniformis]|uniref:HTH cro/C1-type domain-containing protein n=1 Tax=Caulifigura coniformis TaxID=2527983 RepID=A0A517S8I7_9PLAN|nr:helix-turn-helix transcriptional regulator [Caulifigura coniformis]QDT52430.1 hypothetical protein Pan44_04410 [Caulifigura coniformis]